MAESPQANRERDFIRAEVAQGKTKDQIKKDLVAQYGPNVLALPASGDGVNWAVYVVPAVIVLAALGALLVFVPRWRRRSHDGARSGGPRAVQGRPAAGRPRTRPPRLTMAAAQADTTVLAAFAVGFVSFISPCVLPLVPGYLSAVSGVSVAEMQTGERTPLEDPAPGHHLLPLVHGHVRGAGHDRHRHRLDAGLATATCSTSSPAA